MGTSYNLLVKLKIVNFISITEKLRWIFIIF